MRKHQTNSQKKVLPLAVNKTKDTCRPQLYEHCTYLCPWTANVFRSCCVSDAPILIFSGASPELRLKNSSTPDWFPRNEKNRISVLCNDVGWSANEVLVFCDRNVNADAKIRVNTLGSVNCYSYPNPTDNFEFELIPGVKYFSSLIWGTYLDLTLQLFHSLGDPGTKIEFNPFC